MKENNIVKICLRVVTKPLKVLNKASINERKMHLRPASHENDQNVFLGTFLFLLFSFRNLHPPINFSTSASNVKNRSKYLGTSFSLSGNAFRNPLQHAELYSLPLNLAETFPSKFSGKIGS